MKIPKLKLNQLKDFFGKLPRFSGKHQFITALILIFSTLILGSIIFYKYSVLVEKKEPVVLEHPLLFNEKAFQEILKIWDEREKKFEEADFKKYPDPFQGTKIELTE